MIERYVSYSKGNKGWSGDKVFESFFNRETRKGKDGIEGRLFWGE